MKQGSIVLVAVLVSALAACERDKKSEPYGTEPTATPQTTAANPGYTVPPRDLAPAGPNTPAVTFTDVQSLGIIDVANSGEIDAANDALKKAKNERVRTFALRMLDDHKQSQKDFTDLAKTFSMSKEPSDASRQIESDNKKLMDDLKTAKDAEYDRRYIDAQVKAHRDLLEMIDKTLIPAAQNRDLKTLLQKTRDKVSEHLRMARDVQGTVSKA
jgi:putative membrane protein